MLFRSLTYLRNRVVVRIIINDQQIALGEPVEPGYAVEKPKGAFRVPSIDGNDERPRVIVHGVVALSPPGKVSGRYEGRLLAHISTNPHTTHAKAGPLKLNKETSGLYKNAA